MSALYLVHDEDRTIALVAEDDGKLFAYVPNVDAFVYNKPMSVDFLIDRNKQYEPIDGPAAAQIIHEGKLGKIDRRTSKTLMEWATTEPRRLSPTDVLDANTLRADVEPSAAEVAAAKADLVRTAAPGTWFNYKTYPAASKQPALQAASHIRNGRVKAFADIDVVVQVVRNKNGDHVVQVARRDRTAAPVVSQRVAAVRTARPTPPPAAPAEGQRAAAARKAKATPPPARRAPAKAASGRRASKG
ncbi:hypothetical protein [Mycolicibacterium llatzerense]|uniref:hypothetical protein n=1 Tax=Mycolicibacterium llatzerense TaxID=280871 RepID=UPI0021B54730|nr:hypothetical protein [Mycolicibacterium llatzerense]MCT7371962.1 hypothetical protein [Mycolicibacterium llatzerense]